MHQSGRSRLTAAVRARAGLLQITGAAVLWGTTGVVVQAIHRSTGLPALTIGCYRLTVSAVALLLITGSRWRLLLTAVRDHPVGLVLAGIGLGAYQALYFVSVVSSGVTVATMVSLGLAPVVTAVWDSVAGRSRPALRQVLTVGAAVAGLVLLALGQHHTTAAPHPVLGLAAAIGSGLIYGCSAILGRRLSQTVPALAMTTVTSAVGALAVLPAAAVAGFAGSGSASGADVGWSAAGLVYIGVFTTALAYGLFNTGLRSTASSVASVLTLMESLTAMVLAVVLLDEPLGALVLIGSGLLLGAVAALYLAPPGEPAAVAVQ